MKHEHLLMLGAAAVGLIVLVRWKHGAAPLTLGAGAPAFAAYGHPGLSPTFNAPATPAQVIGPAVMAPAPPVGPAFVIGAPGGSGVTPYVGDPGFKYAGGVAPEWWAAKNGTYNDPRGNNWHGALTGLVDTSKP